MQLANPNALPAGYRRFTADVGTANKEKRMDSMTSGRMALGFTGRILCDTVVA